MFSVDPIKLDKAYVVVRALNGLRAVNKNYHSYSVAKSLADEMNRKLGGTKFYKAVEIKIPRRANVENN